MVCSAVSIPEVHNYVICLFGLITFKSRGRKSLDRLYSLSSLSGSDALTF